MMKWSEPISCARYPVTVGILLLSLQLYYSFTMSRLELGHSEVLSSYNDTEVVRAKPAVHGQPSRFDPVIVLDTPEAESTGVQGKSHSILI